MLFRSTFEFSEGSDGSLHVKTTDENGIPIDPRKVELPSDYPDSAVKAELEKIKQQQADILARLEQPVETQLTGSNVELISVSGMLVGAGSTSAITSTIDVSDYVFVYMNASRDSKHTYETILYIRQSDGGNITTKKLGEGNFSITTDVSRPHSTYIAGGIKNTDTVDHTYSLTIFGLKG